MYVVKRGYSKKDECYKYGVFKDGELYQKLTLFGKKNANLVMEYLKMIEASVMDEENGKRHIMQIMKIDRERLGNGKVEREAKVGRE